MLHPKIQGRIREALGIGAADSVPEVGSGNGYLAACLSLLGAATRSLDIHPQFTAAAKANLRAVPEASVDCQTLDAFDATPFGEDDAIAVNGSLTVCDHRLRQSSLLFGLLFHI